MKKSINFHDLIGQKAKLYLAAPNANQFQLGTLLFEVIEDENDGYRSSMDEVRIIGRNQDISENRFLATVTIGYTKEYARCSDSEIYTLTDDENHIWLAFGTNNSDDYYPMFVFEWKPKEPLSTEDIIDAINE